MARWSVLIRGGRIIDGTGNPWLYGDVALAGDLIDRVAPPGVLDPAEADEVVDAAGQVVCPGFIDIQSHSIIPFLGDRRSLSKVTQGVTTEIMGEDWTPAPFGGLLEDPFPRTFPGGSGDDLREWNELARTWTKFGDWLRDLESRGVSVNVGSFLGHGTLREYAKAMSPSEATPGEIAIMRDVLDAAMRDGAFGLATALIYPPSTYATTDELVAMMEVVAKYNGIHITHMRSEETKIFEALEETLEIARRTGVITEIYHLKVTGRNNWHMMPEVMARIDAARAEGIDVTADMYPYDRSGTGLCAVLPHWVEADGKLWDNLADPAARARIHAEIRNPPPDFENLGGVENGRSVYLAGLRKPENTRYNGRVLADVAAEQGKHWADTAMDLLLDEHQDIFCFYHEMTDDNLRLQLTAPWIKISTDAGGNDPANLTDGGLLHPRAFGTYTRVLGHYSRDLGVIPLEDAVRKMSSSVADRLGLRDRGLLRDGMKADVVIFNPETVAGPATFENPHQLSVGVRDVWVNGARVLRDSAHTGAMPGRFLPGPGMTTG